MNLCSAHSVGKQKGTKFVLKILCNIQILSSELYVNQLKKKWFSGKKELELSEIFEPEKSKKTEIKSSTTDDI